MSNDFVNPIFDLFPDSVDDRSIHQYEYVRYAEVNGLDVTNFDGPLYKVVTKDLDSYLLPQKGYCDVVFRIVNGDGPGLITNSTELSSNVLAIFRKISYNINGVPVEEVEFPVLTSTIKNLCEYSQDYVDKQGPMQFFYTDSVDAGAFNAASDRTTRLSVAGNVAKKVRVLIPLNRIFGLLDSYPAAMRGLEHRFEFIREDQINHVVFGNGSNADKVKLDQMSIWIPKLIPSPLAEEKYLSSIKDNDSAIVSYEAWNGYRTYQQTVLAGASLNWQVSASSKKPKYVFVSFQKAGRLNAKTINDNPNIYDNFDITQIMIRVGSKEFPLERYKISFADASALTAGDYTRPYRDFLKIMEKDSEYDNGSLVSYNDYKTLYPIFAFDLSNDHSLFENVQTNYINVEATFGSSTLNEFYSNAVIVWDKEFKISSDGSNVTIVRG